MNELRDRKAILACAATQFLAVLVMLMWFPLSSFAQGNAVPDDEKEILGSWTIEIGGEPLQKMNVTAVEKSDSDKIIYSASSAFACFEGPQAITLTLDTRKNVMTLVSEEGERISLQRKDRLLFAGAVRKKGSAMRVVVAKPLDSAPKVGCTEDVITTTVPYASGVLFKEEKQVPLKGVLWTPENGKASHPLMIFSHGSQNPNRVNTTGSVVLATRQLAMVREFLNRGYAVFFIMRKGFIRQGDSPQVAVSADDAEPVGCDNSGRSEEALRSATADSLALYHALVMKGRADIDLSDVTLVGHSRGAVVALGLAADGLPGVKRVINFSGTWNTTCNGDFTSRKFDEYGTKIKVPTLSFYGDADPVYRGQNVDYNISALKKNGTSSGYILKGLGHQLVFNNVGRWAPLAFSETKAEGLEK